jgi:hypothetical protein
MLRKITFIKIKYRELFPSAIASLKSNAIEQMSASDKILFKV